MVGDVVMTSCVIQRSCQVLHGRAPIYYIVGCSFCGPSSTLFTAEGVMYCPVVVCDSHSVCRGIGSVRYDRTGMTLSLGIVKLAQFVE